ncbi:nicotinate-nucleotide--dimethylbenzimidazole phosphoribosyltransferase [Parasalinivibrio latis]|uniref:nicotinate-nucleotide--dimethylbenzimidazole phosphoribosyltransferase n=1 Tax=Parasalinivibrio latis TaxID=2952610 RepID=UPI0030E2B54B
MYPIQTPDYSKDSSIQARIDNKTKPPGALGLLETIALQIARIQQADKIEIRPEMLIFAADHGIAANPVSIAPQAVTAQMVQNFLAGGAAINCFCSLNQIPLQVVDAGILAETSPQPGLIIQRLGGGTDDFSVTDAMSVEQANLGLELGGKLAEELHSRGVNTLSLGEMGIGNTSSASALMGALLTLTAEECVGRGTGINNEQMSLKISLIEKALKLHENKFSDPIQTLAAVGGFEIAQITGAMLRAASLGMLIVVDGFIISCAALLATRINPDVRHYMVFAHRSHEAGHKRILEHLAAEPLLDLGMRLGEGTGAALSIPLLRAACSFFNDMASLEQAGVTV